MAKKFKKLLALTLAVATCLSMVAVPAQAEGSAYTPEYTVKLVPGKTTTAKDVVSDSTGKTTYEIKAVTSEVDVTTKQTIGEFKSPQPALKFDRNSTADQKVQQVLRDLYTDNGHFSDPAAVVVPEGGPEGYPFHYSEADGDYSGHYVSHIRVIYDREENGEPKVDEDGNYIIKELQHSNGTPLTINLQPTTSLEGPYDQTTGTRPSQFLLKDANGNVVYGYCIDVETGTAKGSWYAVANLEDNEYYASEDAEEHVRGIVFNGYWGTAEGETGSLSSLKAALKAALADGKIDAEYDVHMRNRTANKGQEYDPETQYASANYVYTKLYQHVTLTDEIIDGLTEGEALDAMQCAIWSWANGSNATLDGTDGMIVGDMYYASSAMGDSRNGKTDFEGAARTKALYQWLMQQTAEASTVIVNDKTFADNITLTVKDIGNGIYEGSVSFTIAGYEVGAKDDLSVALTYDGANGAPVTIEKALTGAGALEAEDGVYTIGGLYLREDDPFNFTLNIKGEQYLEKNAYIYTSEGGIDKSQTMVGMSEGYIQIDVTKSFDSEFTTSEKFVPKKDEPGMGTKKDELIERNENRYEVTIDVPGVDGDKRHDEVILMVDGSYSLDQEWPAMKEAINTIAETVLNGSGTTQLTLMAFGMGDNEVIVHAKDAAEVAAVLGSLPGSLLYGRSSTNCEAGFTGVAKYIENHDNTLKDVQVIYISDGNVNTDETPRAFDANWKTWATKYGAQTVAMAAFENGLRYCDYNNKGELVSVYYAPKLPQAFNDMFGDRFADAASRDEILERAFVNGEVTNDEFMAYAEQLWSDVYAYSGLIRGVEYPVSVVERAFVKYDKDHETYIQDLFYYTTYKSSYVTYGNGTARAAAAADKLAAMDKVKDMYVVDYDGKSAWMDRETSTFIQSNGIAGLCEALAGALGELAKTPFNDVVVTDYMSKWVNFIPGTEKVIDNNTGKTIWSAKEGWLIDEGRPTKQAVPVVYELVDPADYEDGGDDVIGNTSGDIYKLTWYVKDGAMLRSDTYRLAYEVTVDTKEEGFVYETDYPANGNTDLHYKDEDGNPKEKPIEVPDVNAVRTAAELKVQKVDENGNALPGAEFTVYSYVDGVKTFIGTYPVDANGELTLELEAGDHLLVETKAPAGYLTAEEDIEITVSEELEVSVKETKAAKLDKDGNLVVANHPPHAAVVLTIDMSGTMYRNKMGGKRYVDVAKEKALTFLAQYAASANNNGKRMLSVVCFDTDAKVQQNWIDVSTASGLAAAQKAIKAIKVADNGKASSNQVCTNFDGGVILARNLLKQDAVKDVDRCFAIILSDGAPTVTVNSDTNTVGTIKSSFWGNQNWTVNGKTVKYQNARCGGGWTHPAEVAKTLTYMNGLKDLTCKYTDANGQEKEGIFIVGVGGEMSVKLFNDAVYGTSNGSRTSDVKKKPAAFNNIDALAGYTQSQIMKLTTGDWMGILAGKVGGTYESVTNATALQNQFTSILTSIKDTTTPIMD